MHYVSTRGQAPELDFEGVLLAGLARDGGLYMPASWPEFSEAEIADLAGRPFAEVAARVIAPFAAGSLEPEELRAMANDAYATFGHPAVTPLVQVGPNRFILELFHGRTLAFKDVAMQMLARLMDRVLKKRGRRLTIVGATSGDTGGAAIDAFRGADNVDVFILFPDGRVSDVQRRMMTTVDDGNVHALAVDGTFDDCQALVKAMFNDHAFRDEVALSGVNSINWARIVAQVTYYFVAATALGAPHRAVSFAVPTGNFGDILAGYVAKCMGLPIRQLVIASNDNDILPRTVDTGVYEMAGVVATSSPSMDIQISSNFERYLFEAGGRDASAVRAMMGSLKQSGRFELGGLAAPLRRDFAAAAASEAVVRQTIARTLRDSGYLLDPHTACGVHAMDQAVHGDDDVSGTAACPQVVLATAHPAKFPDSMEAITGVRPSLPAQHARLLEAPERFEVVANNLATVKDFVAARSAAARRSAGEGTGA